MFGLEAAEVQRLQGQQQPLPAPLHLRAILDTGTRVTAVAPRVVKALGVTPGPARSTQTAGGRVSVSLYQVSFSIYDPAAPPGSNLSRDTWTVTDLPQVLPDVDVLFGMDLVRELTLTVNGPAGTFTLDF
jgi:hypothetical protein